MGQTSKNACPACGLKFRTGGLLPQNELKRLQSVGIVNLGEPPAKIACPKCNVALKVVEVQMGTFFTRE